jgi:hypothetical protein
MPAPDGLLSKRDRPLVREVAFVWELRGDALKGKPATAATGEPLP